MPPIDEVFKVQYERQGDKMVRAMTQPTEELILRRNKKLRQNPGVLKDLSFGRLVANIPLNDLEALKRKYPELAHGDAELRSLTMMKILQMPEYKKFLVQEHV
jgi:hypothetical protein